jgi:hypothetical protein
MWLLLLIPYDNIILHAKCLIVLTLIANHTLSLDLLLYGILYISHACLDNVYIVLYSYTMNFWPNPHPVVCYDCVLDIWIVNEWMNETLSGSL